MVDITTLDELLNRCGPLSAHEAVAIAQQLLAARSGDTEEPAVTTGDVLLQADGIVCCRAGHPSIDALGRLLDVMLPSGNGVRVPGALRFTIARACNSADAPPFASKEALSVTLERFEQGPRAEVVRQLLLRGGHLAVVPFAVEAVEAPRHDRRSSANASALRRELREADARLRESRQLSTPTPEPQPDAPAASPPRTRWAAVAIAAVLGSFAAGYAVTELVIGPRANRPPVEETSAAGR